VESLLQSLFCDFCSPLTVLFTISFYWRAMLYKRGLRLSVSVCLCVRVSVHLSRSWNLSKRRIVTFLIIAPYKYSYLLTYLPSKFFHCRVAKPVFPHQTAWGRASNAGGVSRSDSEPISGFTACCQRCDRGKVLSTQHRRTTVPQVVTLIAGSKRRSLLTAGDDDEMFMTRSLNITPKTTEQQWCICSLRN